MRKRKRLYWKVLALAFLLPAMLLALLPVWSLLAGSLMGKEELLSLIGPALGSLQGQVRLPLFPRYPTAVSYLEVLLDTPEFYTAFWNTLLTAAVTIAGQFLAAAPAAWALSRSTGNGGKALKKFYLLLMLLPFHTRMLSDYLLLYRLGLMDTRWAIILPSIFSAFPVTILTVFFEQIPEEALEAARLDGAGELRIFCSIAIPLGSKGLAACLFLQFLESWNQIEQPMVFLKNKALWPLSLILPSFTLENASTAFTMAFLALLIPTILLAYRPDW